MKVVLIVTFDDGRGPEPVWTEEDVTRRTETVQAVMDETQKQLGRSYGHMLRSIDCHEHQLRWERE